MHTHMQTKYFTSFLTLFSFSMSFPTCCFTEKDFPLLFSRLNILARYMYMYTQIRRSNRIFHLCLLTNFFIFGRQIERKTKSDARQQRRRQHQSSLAEANRTAQRRKWNWERQRAQSNRVELRRQQRHRRRRSRRQHMLRCACPASVRVMHVVSLIYLPLAN